MSEIQEKINVESMKILGKISGEQAEFLMKLTKVKDLIEQCSNLVIEFSSFSDEDKLLLELLKEEIIYITTKKQLNT